MSSTINYSRFDKIDVSSSDDEGKNRKPQITTLNSKDKVVIGPSGLTILKNNSDQNENLSGNINKDKNSSNDDRKNNSESKQLSDTDETYTLNKKDSSIPSDGNKNTLENEKNFKSMILNGGVVPYRYIWNQSPHDINSYIVLPLHCKAKSLVVNIFEDKLVVKRKKSCTLQNDENGEGKGNNNNYDTLINKNFPFKIHMDEDTQLWEIKNIKINWNNLFHLSNKVNNQNAIFDFGENVQNKEETFLYISLKKKNEIENSYIWWASLFKNEEQINLSNLPSRISKNRLNNGSTSFKNVWEEAHEIFKKSISKKGLPVPIDP
ncbi:hypothetical protein POVWA1_047210 [Plasmodium ovale wallikeri]|uniref:CS domain-containing protein n=1 Tax=Plasmodium ovale wallikeri TaxID=864142 RepID=A0A1A8ZGF7_PLAOA|nr:hypothetical protein POVWA1_047210 [Plasmodium ovale wallikeri]